MADDQLTADTDATTEHIRENRLLRMILDAVPARIWFMDREHRTLFANREAARLVGEDATDLIGRPTTEVIGEESFQSDLSMRLEALSGGISRWAGWSTYADGRSRFTERVFHPHYGQDGTITGYYEFVRDTTQERTAQDEARRWAQLLRDAVESLPDAISVEDADGRLAICNSAYADLYRSAPDALLGRNFRERVPRLLQRIVAVAGETFDSAAPDALERFAAYRDNTTGPVEVSLDDGTDLFIQRAFTSEGGRAVLMTDVTELRRREREAEQARQLLEDAIEAVALGFAIFDPEGGLQVCNGLFRTMVGPDEAAARPGLSWLEMLSAGAQSGWFVDPGGDPAGFAGFHDAALSTDTRNPDLELTDGRRLKVWRQATRQGGSVLTLTDVTERRRMERELVESEDLVRQVLEACPVPITMARVDDGTIIYETQATREMMQTDLFAEPTSTKGRWRLAQDRVAFMRKLRKHGVVDNYENQFRRGDGSLIWLSLASRLIDFRGQEVVVTSAFDLTDRRAAQRELEHQREVAQQAEKLGALGELLAGISHELNNPLSVLVGQAAILRETVHDEAINRRVDKIAQAADRCARIVRSFLAMARQGPVQLAPADVNTLVTGATEIAGALLRESDATMRLDLTDSLPPACVDADQIRQVVANLLINAAHALRDWEGARLVTVTTSLLPGREMVRIAVADTGPGVPASIRSRIFEPLFTTKAGGQGTGIGLTLCHRIVSAHGGRIALSDRPVTGAMFTVDLPVANGETAPVAETAKEDAPEPLHFLVVDDDESVRSTTSEVLQLDGHRVDCAGSAEEAIALIERHDYDVVISDVRMPETDGLAFYAQLRERKPALAERFVFATGDMLSQELGRALRATGRPCLEKPFLPSDIRRIVDEVAKASAARR